jgi:GTP-binding protein HflX
LEIFKRNARTQIAKLQIALAEIPYIRHKYENAELYKEVEKKIKRELDVKLKTRHMHNTDRRVRHQLPLVSVFGYTNVGKTSFIKAITNDPKLKPENKLFATLDISYHGTALANSSQSLVFADTIGFISDIPFNLVEAFKTSLQDALDADMYVHLVDVSHPDRQAQEKIVRQILGELAGDKTKLANMLTVYNKCDKGKNGVEASLESGIGDKM